jgi:hypothetical protein
MIEWPSRRTEVIIFRISSRSPEIAVAAAGFPVETMATDSANKDFPLRCAGAL